MKPVKPFPRQTFFSLKRHAKRIEWHGTQPALWSGEMGTCLKLYFGGKNNKEIAEKFFQEMMTLVEWNGGKTDEE